MNRRPPWLSKRALGVFAGAFLVGALLLAGAYLISRESWVADVTINLGSALVLFSPLLLVGNWLERRLGSVERTQKEIRTSQESASVQVSGLAEQVANLELGQDELRQEVMNRVDAAREADREAFSGVERTPSSASVADALERADALGLISEIGTRVGLHNTDLYLRFFLDRPYMGNDYSLGVALEDEAGATLHPLYWHPEATAPDFLLTVTEAVQSVEQYPGDGLWHPELVLRDLRVLLETVHRKATGEEGSGGPLGRVFQLCPPQWAITTTAIVCTDPFSSYRVGLNRLDELDWDRHVTGKTWVDDISFREALDTSRALVSSRTLTGKPLPTPRGDPPF